MTVPSGSLSAGSFVAPVASRSSSRVPLHRKGSGLPWAGDHLVVFNACLAQGFLNAAAWMHPRTTVITVTNEQRWGLGHLHPPVRGLAAQTSVATDLRFDASSVSCTLGRRRSLWVTKPGSID